MLALHNLRQNSTDIIQNALNRFLSSLEILGQHGLLHSKMIALEMDMEMDL